MLWYNFGKLILKLKKKKGLNSKRENWTQLLKTITCLLNEGILHFCLGVLRHPVFRRRTKNFGFLSLHLVRALLDHKKRRKGKEESKLKVSRNQD